MGRKIDFKNILHPHVWTAYYSYVKLPMWFHHAGLCKTNILLWFYHVTNFYRTYRHSSPKNTILSSFIQLLLVPNLFHFWVNYPFEWSQWIWPWAFTKTLSSKNMQMNTQRLFLIGWFVNWLKKCELWLFPSLSTESCVVSETNVVFYDSFSFWKLVYSICSIWKK